MSFTTRICPHIWLSAQTNVVGVRCDTGTGNTVTIWSWVCSGMGMGLALPNPCNTVPVPMVLQVCTGILVPNFWSGEWSYDLVYLLTTTQSTTITPPTTAVSNCSRGGNVERGQRVSNHNGPNDAITSFGPTVSLFFHSFIFS